MEALKELQLCNELAPPFVPAGSLSKAAILGVLILAKLRASALFWRLWNISDAGACFATRDKQTIDLIFLAICTYAVRTSKLATRHATSSACYAYTTARQPWGKTTSAQRGQFTNLLAAMREWRNLWRERHTTASVRQWLKTSESNFSLYSPRS